MACFPSSLSRHATPSTLWPAPGSCQRSSPSARRTSPCRWQRCIYRDRWTASREEFCRLHLDRAWILGAWIRTCRRCLILLAWFRRYAPLCWLAGWLAGWLVGWLVGWLIGWLADWLIDLTDGSMAQKQSTVGGHCYIYQGEIPQYGTSMTCRVINLISLTCTCLQ